MINQGNALVKLKQGPEAVKFYHRALKSIDPQWWEAWNKNRGLPNIDTQNNKAAVKTSDNGIAIAKAIRTYTRSTPFFSTAIALTYASTVQL